MSTNRISGAFALGVFVGAVVVGGRLPAVLNGSLIYAPAFLVLIGLGAYHFVPHKQEPFAVLAASAVFLLSLLFRSIDLAVRPYISVGTHFLWHILNGLVLYLAMRALVFNWPNTGPLAIAAKRRGCIGPPG